MVELSTNVAYIQILFYMGKRTICIPALSSLASLCLVHFLDLLALGRFSVDVFFYLYTLQCKLVTEHSVCKSIPRPSPFDIK
jgi:hypothetical protein